MCPARRHYQQRERGELILNDEPLTFTPEEAALKVKKSADWLKREAGKRTIPCTRIGRTVSFSEQNLRDLVDGGYCEPKTKKGGSRRRTFR